MNYKYQDTPDKNLNYSTKSFNIMNSIILLTKENNEYYI